MKRIRLVKESLYEANGAGFSMSGGFRGGMGGTTRGGFGGAANMGGANSMYTYEIKPLNHTLEQKPTQATQQTSIISIGSKITGTPVASNVFPDKKRKITGIVNRIEETDDGSIKYYIIQDEATQNLVKIEPLSANLIMNEPIVNYQGYDNSLPSRRREKIKNKQIVK